MSKINSKYHKLSNKCHKCKIKLKDSETKIKCSVCNEVFHPNCVDVEDKDAVLLQHISLMCVNCSKNLDYNKINHVHNNIQKTNEMPTEFIEQMNYGVKSNIKISSEVNHKDTAENNKYIVDGCAPIELSTIQIKNTKSITTDIYPTINEKTTNDISNSQIIDLWKSNNKLASLIDVLFQQLETQQRLLDEKSSIIITHEKKIQIMEKLFNKLHNDIKTNQNASKNKNEQTISTPKETNKDININTNVITPLTTIIERVNNLETKIGTLSTLQNTFSEKLKTIDYECPVVKQILERKTTSRINNKQTTENINLTNYNEKSHESKAELGNECNCDIKSINNDTFKFNCKIKIVNVTSDINTDTILANLTHNNIILQNNEFKIIDIFKVFCNNENINKYNVVIGTSYAIQRQIIDHKYLIINGKKHRCFEYIIIKQCSNCWSFHHLKHQCTNHTVCKICAQNHHHRNCKQTLNPVCVNCNRSGITTITTNAEHKSTYGGCLMRLQYLNNVNNES